jgi:hypothetical protein
VPSLRLTFALTLASLAALPAAASAQTFCVDRAGCTGTEESTLQAAVTAARTAPGADTILLGAGRFAGAIDAETGNPVEVAGLGAARTVVADAIDLGDPGTVIRGLGVESQGTGIVGSGRVEDVSITAPVGAYGLASVRRTRISATQIGAANVASISDTIIAPSAGATGLSLSSCERSTDVRATLAQNLTIVGDSSPGSIGAAVSGAAGTSCDGTNPVSLDLRNSIVADVAVPLRRSAEAGTQADAHVGYSNLDESKIESSGPGAVTLDHNGFENPGFVDAAHADYRLRFDSPLIDQGTPRIGPDLGGLDVDRRLRVVDGNRQGRNAVDMGAHEYQHAGPTAVAFAGPAVADPRENIIFDGSASHDPDGGLLRYEWAFGDSTGESGVRVAHAYDHPGTFTAYLTVTDDAGLTAITSRSVTIRPWCKVPDVGHRRLADARRLIARGHCTVGRISSHSSTTVRRGLVIAQRPSPGSLRDPRWPVNLQISSGKPRRR